MKDIVLHCSDSTWGDAKEIDSWHKQKGFGKIGYHRVILNGKRRPGEYKSIDDGKIENGRELNERGAHCIENNDAIGICLIGKSGQFTDAQIVACFFELQNLKKIFNKIIVYQHSDFNKKSKSFCAGFTGYQMERFNKV